MASTSSVACPELPRRRLALAGACGLLLALAFPGPGLWPLAFLAHAPLLLALERSSPRQAAALGWLAYALANLLVLRFLWAPLRALGGLPLPLAALALLLLAALQGLQGAALGLLTSLGQKISSLPAAFVLSFLVAGHTPCFFPWSLAAALPGSLPWVQAASLGGAGLVSLLVAVSSVGVATVVSWRTGRCWPGRWVLASGLPVVLGLGWGWLREAQLEGAGEGKEAWEVGVVHGAIPLRADGPPELAGWLRLHEEGRKLAEAGARLVVLPETILPWPAREGALAEDTVAQLPGEIPAATLLGGVVETPLGAMNGALLVEGAEVRVAGVKRVLLPFGEYIPLEAWFPWLQAFSPRTARLVVPEREAEVRWRDHRLGLSICFEGMLPGRVREAAGQGRAELLVNLTNDAWFPGTQEPALHWAHTRLRAVELGRYLVRSSNLGVSAVIDPLGRVVQQAEGWPSRGLRATVQWRQELTPYARWGELPGWLVGLGVGLLFRRYPPRQRCQGGASGPVGKT